MDILKQVKTSFAALLLLLVPNNGMANAQKTVVSVNEQVVVNDAMDFIITSDTPFGNDGWVDIANEQAVLILNKVKPSKVSSYLSHVKINGTRASIGANCQVRIHNIGAIILPYGNNVKPLTVFSEKDFGGDAVDDFGLENSGGFMNTLSDAKLNNRIKSFKLKRGYMVTFSTLPRGRGYSRCFIAADGDLEFAELPQILSGRISSYRIFKWNYNSKSGLANDTRADPCSKLNVTSCYSFGLGEDRGLNTECVPHHIYEDWPSASACGSVTYSPHMKTNNEPGNSADDHPQSVDDILANWENLMATGMRLCSPSSHDGSLNHLRAFMDSIDARGWRCDIIDLHCYWTEGSFNNIKGSWVDRYKRPIWISEWVWGASWNNNGIFGIATGDNRNNPTTSQLNQNKTAIQSICTKLNSWDYIERYFYWNSEANCSKLYLSNGTLTPAGEYYASMNTGVGYNGKYEFIPTTPRQYGISNYSISIANGIAVLKWHDQNGEYNQLMEVQRKTRGGQWQVLATIEQKEAAANYVFQDTDSPEGAQYRVHIVDLNGVDYFTNDDFEVGDIITDSKGENRYMGGNIIFNGEFDWGTTDWKNGAGTDIAQPYFQVVPVGGHGGGAYLQAYGSGGIDHAASLKRVVEIEPNKEYVFSIATRKAGKYVKAALSKDGKSESVAVATAAETSDWQKQSFVFNSQDYSQLLLAFRWLNATGQIDKVELRQLFATQKEAMIDGFEELVAMASLTSKSNQELPFLNDELETILASLQPEGEQSYYQAQAAIDNLKQALSDKLAIDSMMNVVSALNGMQFAGRERLDDAVNAAHAAATAEGIMAAKTALEDALNAFFPMTDAETQPVQPNFATSNGWEVKTGTYTGGDQRVNTVNGKSCWNAWWSGISASEGLSKTMGVRQKIEKLEEGLYALECKATTEHYCLSDQRGYISNGSETVNTPSLKADYFDLPTVGNIWQTLTTTPVYVPQDGELTIGFTSSKQGAIDNAWHRFGDTNNTGDKREGWWCATDFVLKYHPIHKMAVAEGEWGTICRPYAFDVPQGVRCFRIAGILPDHSKICIEEMANVAAGQPCIFLASSPNLIFYEYGEKASSASYYANENNLRGFFVTSARVPLGSYVLSDGKWCKVSDERPVIENYTAFIYKLDGIEEINSWDGLTMDIVEDPDGISTIESESQQSPVVNFSISGQRTNASKGLMIVSKGHKARKIVKK